MTKKEISKLKQEALEAMQEQIEESDTEMAHAGADGILCELLRKLGFEEVVEAYDKVSKWYA